MARDPSDYDVALSFAGENRPYVAKVAKFLKSRSVRVFYDEYEEAKLWGEDLYVHLDEVYRKRAQYCVMFISKEYATKLWTNHERKSAQARAFTENRAYLLPARFDDTEIPGIPRTVGYIDLRGRSPEELGELILQRLEKSSPAAPAGSVVPSFRKPKVKKAGSFNPYAEAQRFIAELSSEAEKRCATVEEDGIACSVFARDGRTCIRVLRDGATAYSLDVWLGGGFGNDSSLTFYGIAGEAISGINASNASGTLKFDEGRNLLVIDLFDMSLLSHAATGRDRSYSFTELIDAIWERMCDAIEGSR